VGQPETIRGSLALLGYMREAHDTWHRDQDTFGDGRNTALVRLVMIGWMERKPHDHTSLAHAMRSSRSQVMRRVEALDAEGWVMTKRDANHVHVLPTEALIERTREKYKTTLPVVAIRWGKVASMFAALPIGEAVHVASQVVG
jgi:hypothetical protein